MIARVGEITSELFRRTAPDPFVIAILLTVATLLLGWRLSDATLLGLIGSWAGTQGVWNPGILTFALQMCLILVTGHALASSPPMSRLLDTLARLPRSPAQACLLVGVSAITLGLVNWGLGLIGGALLARRVGIGCEQQGIPVHYPLLAASGYLAMLVWHGGLSGSAPLKVTTPEQMAELGLDAAPLAFTSTVLSPMNLLITGGLLILAPTLLALMLPPNPAKRMSASTLGVTPTKPRAALDTADKPLIPRLLEDSPIVSWLLVAMIGAWAWMYYFPASGPSGITQLTPNTVNLTMLMLGLILHGSPSRYIRAIEAAAGSCAGIILQFPLYAGIMGLMAASGLSQRLAGAVDSLATAETLPLLTFASAALLNLFVPSGGGQWAIQGPIALEAAAATGADPAKVVMSVAYGDQLTNMLQPFWALPLLAITGVKARDIVGYTAIVMAVAAVWIAVCLWLW